MWPVAYPDWAIALLRYFNPIGAHGERPDWRGSRGHPQQSGALHCAGSPAASSRSFAYLATITTTVDGTGVRDYIHVVDLARGHVAACRYLMAHKGCEVFNIGTGQGYSVLQVLKTFERVNGVAIPYDGGARAVRAISPPAMPTRARQKRCSTGRRKRPLRTCAATRGGGRAITPLGYAQA